MTGLIQTRRFLMHGMFCLLAASSLSGCIAVMAGGAAVGVMSATDRRSAGTQLDDQAIESTASTRIKEEFSGAVRINITSFNRQVLLTGQVADTTKKASVERIVKAIPNVRWVFNELAIGPSPRSGINDARITSQVKARLAGSENISTNHVKVVTEQGAVYLMGILTRAEAKEAVDVTRNTQGVARVVTGFFEYLD